MSLRISRAELSSRVLDLFYPPRCGGCDRRGGWFCDDCRLSVAPARDDPHSIMGIKALVCGGAFDGPLREAIHHLKYENDRPLARPLAELVHDALQRSRAWPRMEAVKPVLVPVPLHKDRRRARGFNQSHLLAVELAKQTAWQVDTSLHRIKSTRSQVGLSAEERNENVLDAFSWESQEPPAAVLLLDDVFTTGSTLGECVATVRAAGACEIYVATVARTVGEA